MLKTETTPDECGSTVLPGNKYITNQNAKLEFNQYNYSMYLIMHYTSNF